MTSVIDMLEKAGYGFILNPREFRNIKPMYADKFNEFINDAISSKDSIVAVHPDTDIDGMFSAKIILDTIGKIKPITVLRRLENHHGITKSDILNIIKMRVTHLIIVDSSTNEMENIKRLCEVGIKVCIIDHHINNYFESDYPDNCLLLNNQVMFAENRLPYCNASCGLLCTLYVNYYLQSTGFAVPKDIWSFAVFTLYSDCVSLLDEFNIMIINYVRRECSIPKILRGLVSKKTSYISRNTISYSINPKINACLRLERFDLVYELLFSGLTFDSLTDTYDEMKKLNSELKEYLSDLEKKIPVFTRGQVYMVDVSSQSRTVYTNFKGLIANKVGAQSGCLTIGFYILNGTVYGSVRDPLGRDFLSVFKDFCEADGHPSAFGFKIQEDRLDGLLDYVSGEMTDIECKELKPIIINERDIELDRETLRTLCIFNEYATTNTVMLRISLNPELYSIKSSRFGYIVQSSKMRMEADIPVSYGATVLAQPVFGDKLILKIKTVGG